MLLALSIGALTLVALSPAPSSGVPERASALKPTAVGEPASSTGTADTAAATSIPSSSPPSPIADTPAIRSDLGRADVAVRDAAPTVKARHLAGSKAVFLGDSYTTGWNGAGIGRHGWPTIVGRTLGWRTVNLAVAGTGFMNPGWTNQAVGARVAATIRQKPDIVVVAAGHNDSRWSVETTSRAADAVLDRLRRALPDATIMVVAPIWSSDTPPARCLELRDHLRRTARSMGATFVDPLAGRWFAGIRQRLIGPDGLHPTDAGHRYIAQRFLEAIAAT